ncbi:hypothetical protein [Virgisporangium ochraceum]|uniref:hypothetical protein n=1 Tax=Virgisporangium ochraceum TaxID=65505 RepID=UPI00194474EA|nr:hypothetical protein [Virgisporangium ochraceum]
MRSRCPLSGTWAIASVTPAGPEHSRLPLPVRSDTISEWAAQDRWPLKNVNV